MTLHPKGNDEHLNRLIQKRDFQTVFANLVLRGGGGTDEVIAARPLILRGLAEGRRGHFRSALNWFNCANEPIGTSEYLYYPGLAYLALGDTTRAASDLFGMPMWKELLSSDDAAKSAGIMLNSSIFNP